MKKSWVKDKLRGIINNHRVDYPTPSAISYL